MKLIMHRSPTFMTKSKYIVFESENDAFNNIKTISVDPPVTKQIANKYNGFYQQIKQLKISFIKI